jgi:phosphoribosylformimino-5-aminoimidazole carboxamide ribotide isomerase
MLVAADCRPLIPGMRILPVLDVLGGQVVRGVAGLRSEYRPVVSRLTPSRAPLAVASAFAERFDFRELYLADLDAIAGADPLWATYAELHGAGFRLWADAGVRRSERALQLAASGIDSIVVGLETVDGPGTLAEVVAALGDRAVFSLDLRQGVPLGEAAGWQAADGWSIARQAIGLGVRRLLVLDLARVGVGTGTGTEELCARIVANYPQVEVSAGGGVRGRADLERLARAGVRVVLLASALHDGTLRPDDLRGLGS